jgi:hypothetical protein
MQEQKEAESMASLAALSALCLADRLGITLYTAQAIRQLPDLRSRLSRETLAWIRLGVNQAVEYHTSTRQWTWPGRLKLSRWARRLKCRLKFAMPRLGLCDVLTRF